MKGEISGNGPKMLSVQLVSIDTRDGRMTVREVLYNHTDLATDTSIKWGLCALSDLYKQEIST